MSDVGDAGVVGVSGVLISNWSVLILGQTDVGDVGDEGDVGDASAHSGIDLKVGSVFEVMWVI